ncbi:MAG: DUF3488 and transglutaminase-like domain-containing protein [Sandaracinus sp.]
MSFTRLHKLVTYALAGLGLSALALGGELGPLAVGAIVLFTIASWWCEGERLESLRWQRGITIAMVLWFVIEIARGVGGAPLLPLALETSAALQISRLASRRRAAEHQQIAILAFLHLCAATVLSTEVTYGFLFFGFVVLVPWMLALTHLRAEIEGHFAPAAAPPADRAATLARVLASRRLVGPGFLLGTAAIAIPLFLTTAILFVAFPRVGFGFLGVPGSMGLHVAGFGSDVTLGDVGTIADDPTVVMRVVPHDVDLAHPPALLPVRFRGTSFDAYDGRRWTRTFRGGERLRRYGDELAITRAARAGRDVAWDIVLEHIDQPVVFLPPRAVAIDVPPRYSAGLDVGRDLTLYPGLDLRYEDPDALGLHYTVWTSPHDEPSRERLGEDELRRYLQLPEGHERLAAIAREWTAGATTDRERAERILAHFARPPFRYSRVMPDVGAEPPLVAFLEHGHVGHCEYFASAMAILLREVGVPSRNVTGFVTAHYNAYGRYWAVRSGDAHAWVEAFLPGEGWVTFDPTPSTAFEPSASERVLAELRALSDAVRARWEEWIVGYDLRTQRDLGRRLARWLGGMSTSSEPSVRQATGETSAERPSPWRIAILVALVIVLGIVVDRVYRRLLLGRRAPSGRAIEARVQRVVALYQALEREMTRLGTPRPPSATPVEHARALAARGAPHAAIVERVTARYVDARFGGAVLEPTELAALEREVQGLRALSRAA